MKKYYYLFKVSIEKTFKEILRYKFNTISNILLLYVVFMAMFLGVKSFGLDMGVSPIEMGDTLEGFVIGYFLWSIMMMSYEGVAYGIIDDASRGTLEQLNMSGIKLSTIVTIRSISGLLTDLIISYVLLFIIMITTKHRLQINLVSIVLPIFLGIFSILGIGLICGGLALIFKKVQSLLSIIQYFLIAFIMISPNNIIIYNLIPFRPAVDFVFRAMREGFSLTEFSYLNYGVLIGNSLLYFVIGLIVFDKCVNIAKLKGVLGQY